MRSPVFQTPMTLTARGSLLLLCVVVICVCNASSAWATCGDYLHGHGMSGHNGYAMSEHFSSDSAAALPMSSDRGQRPACSGPNCRQRDPVPVAPTKHVDLPQIAEGILSSIARVPSTDGNSAKRATDTDHDVDGPVGRIFRPPRTV